MTEDHRRMMMMGAVIPPPTPPAPTPPTGAFARYRATDLAGTHADGNPVAAWPDATGNGRTASQATALNQPTFRTAMVNGNDVVDFLISTRFLSTGAFTALPVSTWAGLVHLVVQTGDRVWWDGSNLGRHAVFKTSAGNYALFAGVVLSSATAVTEGVHDIIAVFNGASSLLVVDGVEIASGNAGAQQIDTISLGAEFDAANPTNIRMIEAFLYDRALDAGERTAMRNYLLSTY